MEYSLALQLKNAGFHQGSATGDHHDGGKWIVSDGDIYPHETGDSDECYIPTLEELIEACGDGFGFLEKADGNFVALEPRNQQTIPFMAYMATPSEAVALLWLALNKKP